MPTVPALCRQSQEQKFKTVLGHSEFEASLFQKGGEPTKFEENPKNVMARN